MFSLSLSLSLHFSRVYAHILEVSCHVYVVYYTYIIVINDKVDG